jgi:hypothetical protein
LRKRFQMAIAEGDLPPGTSAEALAQYIMVVAWGLALEGQSGSSRRELRRVAKAAMQAWPNQTSSRATRRPAEGGGKHKRI